LPNSLRLRKTRDATLKRQERPPTNNPGNVIIVNGRTSACARGTFSHTLILDKGSSAVLWLGRDEIVYGARASRDGVLGEELVRGPPPFLCVWGIRSWGQNTMGRTKQFINGGYVGGGGGGHGGLKKEF